MPTVIPPAPLRTQGKTQSQYSSEFEAFASALNPFSVEMNAIGSAYALSTNGTSATSNAISTGSKSFTTQLNLGYQVGQTLRIAANSTNFLTGEVTSYNTATGALVFNVASVSGTGTFTSWFLSQSATGASTAATISATAGGNLSGTTVQAQLVELDAEKLSNAAGVVAPTNLSAGAPSWSSLGDLTVIGGSIELSGGRPADGVSFLDFHSSAGSDYDVRIIKGAGVNGNFDIYNLGTGNIQFINGVNNIFSIASNGAQSSVIPGGTTLLPEFKCRAWVNFNGTGVVAIRGSGNVSSITDNGVGDYTVNFATAMPDANYGFNVSSSGISGTNSVTQSVNFTAPPTSSAFRFQISNSGTGAAIDVANISVSIFR